MNKFKNLSAIILVICSLAAFSSCTDKTDVDTSSTSANENITESIVNTKTADDVINNLTEKQAVTVNVTDKKGKPSVSVSETAKQELKTTVPTTKKTVINDNINEKAVGIFIMTKSDPVQVGNYATIFIQGTPGKTYSIEFYETPSIKADFSDLKDKKADSNGFVSWSFEIRNTCALGKRKIVVKENNSNNYLETSITVK